MDEIDVKILRALQQDGRISMLNLADRVGLSPTPCARRVKQMEDTGVIGSYAALVNPGAVGLKVAALIDVQLHHSKEAAEAFERRVMRMPEVTACFVITGANDYLLYVVANDIDDLARFSRDHLITVPGVVHTHTSVVLEVVKFTTELPIRTEAPEEKSGQTWPRHDHPARR